MVMELTRNLHIVLLIGVVCVVQAIAVICPYSDLICSCDSEILCYGLQQIPPLITGDNVGKFTYLTFQVGNITNIPSNSLPPGLTLIELSSHPISSIADDAFDSSADTLETFTIKESHLTSLPTALKKLSKLIRLFIDDTPIQVWDTATLKQIAPTVENLALRNVSLSTWPSWISDFNSLLTLDLSGNPLNAIPDDAFNSLKESVTVLELRNTGLTHVPQALSTLSSLISLDLRNNNFTDVSEIERIAGSPFARNLTDLFLDSSGLTGAANLTNLTSLKVIGLSNNRISDVAAGSLPRSLIALYLSNNSLSSVPQDVAFLNSLTDLYLSNNRIKEIEPTSFPSSLVYLDLHFNNLTVITNTTFTHLSLLEHLLLNFNPISTIEPAAFSDLVSLQQLSLIETHLTEIPLAFSLLSPQTDLSITTTQPFSCPCPAPRELVEWYSSRALFSTIHLYCSSGQLIDSYLSGQCR
ncbi:unnamed protein product [Candidula unifasciata]|uniref:Uncharacterized protein n=1 Tax=Candidula unifasciata TaxID=100452 RepID=A0A8S3YVR6_9EUPU|nr:unnamed protein product [Candidula unifasciata]